MKRFKIINQYQKFLLDIIKQEKIIPQVDIYKNIDPSHHTVTIPCRLPNKPGDWLFRILITSDQKKNESFVKEVKLFKILEKYKNNFNKLPNLAKVNLKTKTKWMIRKYYQGNPTGNFWSFNKTFFNARNSNLLINYLIKLQSKSLQINPDFKKINQSKSLPIRGSEWFTSGWQKDLDYNPDFCYKKFISEYFTVPKIKKINTLFIKNRKLLDHYAYYLTHGDLMPQNILIDKYHNIFFIDWEETHLNNPLFDVSYIYVNSWQHKLWRKNFLNNFINNHPDNNKENLKILANINIVLISLRMAEYAYLNKVHKNKIIDGALNTHLKSIKNIIN